MKTHGNMSLENNKLFPYIAWALCIGFSIFTIKLTLDLISTTEEMALRNDRLVEMINDNSDRLDSLERTTSQ